MNEGYDNELKCGLWLKTSQSGTQYKTGVIKIDGVEYWLNIFDNREKRKDNPKAPIENAVMKRKDKWQ